MCTQTRITYAECPCRMTRIALCPAMQQKEDHAGHHLEPAPDPRDCHELNILDEKDAGCCEMAPGGTCPYAGGWTREMDSESKQRLRNERVEHGKLVNNHPA